MIDQICLVIGRIVLFGGGGAIILFLLGGCLHLLWHKVFQYWFFKIKHLFPWWQPTQEFIDEWKRVAKTATDWRGKVTVEQKGRFIIWRSPESHWGERIEYMLIKK